MPRRQGQQRSRSSTSQKGSARKKQKKAEKDEFFEAASGDEDLLSSGEDYEDDKDAQSLEEKEEDIETADEKRLRLAKAHLEKIRASTKQLDGADGVDGHADSDVDEDAKQREALGARDSIVANILQQEQLERSERVQRKLANRLGPFIICIILCFDMGVAEPEVPAEGKNIGRRHRQSVTAVALSEDDAKGFAASKDGLIVQWDVETGSSDKYCWPTDPVIRVGSNANGKKKPGSRNVLALAVSSDGRYLATGGLDRTVHLWDTRTQKHLQAFGGHRGAVSSLVFRQGTLELMSASYDRTIKLWSVADGSYIDTLFGHQSEVLTIDCLRQEHVLSAGRDRTLRKWKIPDETQLVFRGHAASMECCCFISNNDFLSGSDDGCVALWNVTKKKPLALMKNAHGVIHQREAGGSGISKDSIKVDTISAESEKCYGNGDIKHHAEADTTKQRSCGVESWVGAVAVCRGSDLAASGAGDGQIRLWALEEDNRNLRALHCLPTKGFVNSLAIARSGRFLIAGLGQEPRLGRWGRNARARNGVVQHMLIPS